MGSALVKEEKAPVTQQIAKTPSKKFMLVKALGKIKRDLPIKTPLKSVARNIV